MTEQNKFYGEEEANKCGATKKVMDATGSLLLMELKQIKGSNSRSRSL
jgi:hypothetical protein